jgi:hypothetical protein
LRTIGPEIAAVGLVAALAGCAFGGAATQPQAGVGIPDLSASSHQASSESNGTVAHERLKASAVTVTPHCSALVIGSSFSATGTASGTYPGTLVAQGAWGGQTSGAREWGFIQNFTITSNPYTVKGSVNFRSASGLPPGMSCSTISGLDLTYTADVVAHGKVVKRLSGRLEVINITKGDLRDRLH